MNILDYVVDTKKAAELWGLSQSHVKLLCNQKLINAKKIGTNWGIDITQPNPKKYRLEGLEEKKMYMKHVDTGVVKTMAEWTEIAIREFTEVFSGDESLQEEFKSLQVYLKWAEQRGQLYVDLVECDKKGNEIDYIGE